MRNTLGALQLFEGEDMALVACKECGAEVAESAPVCPRCGVLGPAGRTSQLVLTRKQALAGFAHMTKAVVDGRTLGRLKIGGLLAVDLTPGEHELVVFASGPNTANDGCMFEVRGGETAEFECGFHAWGGFYVKQTSSYATADAPEAATDEIVEDLAVLEAAQAAVNRRPQPADSGVIGPKPSAAAPEVPTVACPKCGESTSAELYNCEWCGAPIL